MAKRRNKFRAYQRALRLRWRRFLERFNREIQSRNPATKVAKGAGIIGTAIICAG
ncbi:MAG: hypothetical protein IKN12_11855 [Selenomonadaceae bacterium]|nr:hypothetical protein [Selenomonadaceae bacterium]